MPLAVIAFTIVFLLMALVMVAVSFHVFRYRYDSDPSAVIFTTFAIIFILMAVLVFSLFNYSSKAQSSARSGNILNPLL